MKMKILLCFLVVFACSSWQVFCLEPKIQEQDQIGVENLKRKYEVKEEISSRGIQEYAEIMKKRSLEDLLIIRGNLEALKKSYGGDCPKFYAVIVKAISIKGNVPHTSSVMPPKKEVIGLAELELLEKQFEYEKGGLDTTELKMMRGELRALGNSIDPSLIERLDLLFNKISTQIIIVESKESGIIDRGIKPGEGIKPVQRVKPSVEGSVMIPQEAPAVPTGMPRMRQTRSVEEIVRERKWVSRSSEVRAQVRVKEFIEQAIERGLIIGEKPGPRSESQWLQIGGKDNKIFLLRSSGQPSGGSCGTCSMVNCSYIGQFFAPQNNYRVSMRFLQNLRDALGEEVRDIARQVNENYAGVRSLTEQNQFPGVEWLTFDEFRAVSQYIPRIRFNEDLFVFPALPFYFRAKSAVAEDAQPLYDMNIANEPDGFSRSFVLPNFDEEGRMRYGHYICVHVVKAGGRFYWFVLDSMGGRQLSGNSWNRIEFMIYRLLGEETLGLPYDTSIKAEPEGSQIDHLEKYEREYEGYNAKMLVDALNFLQEGMRAIERVQRYRNRIDVLRQNIEERLEALFNLRQGQISNEQAFWRLSRRQIMGIAEDIVALIQYRGITENPRRIRLLSLIVQYYKDLNIEYLNERDYQTMEAMKQNLENIAELNLFTRVNQLINKLEDRREVLRRIAVRDLGAMFRNVGTLNFDNLRERFERLLGISKILKDLRDRERICQSIDDFLLRYQQLYITLNQENLDFALEDITEVIEYLDEIIQSTREDLVGTLGARIHTRAGGLRIRAQDLSQGIREAR